MDALNVNREFDKIMNRRTNAKLSELKEMIVQFLGSISDAYSQFDSSKVGRMSYIDFS